MNERVRGVHGLHGTVVVLGAWCPTCRCEAMPTGAGRCGWCDTRILDETALHPGEVTLSATAPASAPVPAPRRRKCVYRDARLLRPPAPAGHRLTWTADQAVAAVRAYAHKHARPPSALDRDPDLALPGAQAAKRLYGSWKQLITVSGVAWTVCRRDGCDGQPVDTRGRLTGLCATHREEAIRDWQRDLGRAPGRRARHLRGLGQGQAARCARQHHERSTRR